MTGFVAITGSRRPEDRGVLRRMLRTSAWGVLAAGLSVGTPALAQSANAPAQGDPATSSTAQGDEAGVGEILVVGTRASLQSAIARKRKAETVVDSIVADDIASFPDKNVGDSLARITGVQLSRDFGEGVKVSIRGVEPDLNRVEINGVSQMSATGERSGDFRELATELVKSIDVYKGYSANLTEGGLGGTVSIETRRPLDLAKPLATLVASAQHLDTTEDWRPRVTLVLGTPHFLLDGLGVLANVTYDDKTTRQDYISNTNWQRIADFDRSDQKTVADPNYANFNTYASCAGVGGATTAAATARRLACETQFFDWVPTVPRYRNWVRRDKRISADFQLQYEFARNFRAFASAQINNRDQNLQDANYSLDTSRFERFNYDAPLAAGLNGATSRPQITAGTATVGADHVVTSFRTADNSVNIGTAANPVYNGASNILSVQRRNFSYDQKSKYYTTGFNWDIDRLNLKFLASRATGKTIQETNLLAYATGVSGVTVDRRNDQGIPVFNFPTSVNPADPSIYTDFTRRGANGQLLIPSGPTLQYRPGQLENSENQLKLDADWDTGLPFLKTLQYGAQLRWLEFLNYMGGGSRLITPAVGSTPAKYQSSANVSFTTNIVNNVTTRRNGNTFFLTPAEYVALVNGNSTQTGGAPLFSGLQGAPSSIPSRLAIPEFNSQALSQYYDLSGFDQDLVLSADGLPQIPNARIKETVAAGYLQADMETQVLGMRLSGNAGVRYVYTRDTGTGTNISRVTRRTATGGTETVVLAAQELSLSTNYVDILPTFNALLEITPDLVLRGNWAKNVARPRPLSLVPNINCLDDQTVSSADDVCSAGNPDLKPYRVSQWEANLAWYPNKDTMVSLGYYKKDISSFVIENITRSGVDLFRDGITYTVRQPVNGQGALLDGIEATAQTAFTFLPQPFDGFGASGNVTFARAIRTNLINNATNAALTEYPGLSKWTWNASMFYDKGWLNARLSYNYRSDWLDTVASATNGNNPLYRKGEGYLDAKVVFRFPQWHYQLFMEMQNIGKEYSELYINKSMPVDLYYPGQRFFAGFQLKF
ncbi:TonB-dependent receptor [uncultured Sphingomonas sp.]|uniref:TonB-dependent receptor n=1 Tax=uncultured Sphingomonas sp. TaxID=158754 RepID=UPI0025852F89|nr:TonB-dependent receptor [uncultured Sphingomonas sp.]